MRVIKTQQKHLMLLINCSIKVSKRSQDYQHSTDTLSSPYV